jgi:hypothetical protein
MWKRTPAVAAAIILCGACDGPPVAQPAPAAAPSEAQAADGRQWTLEPPATLVYAGADGAPVLRLTCRTGPPGLEAVLPGLTRIGSEDRLTLGVGDTLATLVVSMEGPDTGLLATGQLQPELMAPLLAGRPVGISYGQSQLLLPAPARRLSEPFVKACGGAG